MYRIRNLLSVTVFVVGSTAFAGDLQIQQGTWSLGGRLLLPWSYDSDGVYRLKLNEETEVGYFVADQLKLSLSMEVSGQIRSFDPAFVTPWLVTWGFKGGATYVLDLGGAVYPVMGFKVGFRMQNDLYERTKILFELPLGLWWEMNEHLALSLAVPVELSLHSDFTFHRISLSPGLFGVLGFF